MADKYKIDSQKIAFHPKRVAQWQDANFEWNKIKNIFPIYAEIAPVGACNHRCTFCSVDYLGYKTISQDKDTLLKRIKEMGENGVKSIMFAGEGEPALWKPLPDVMEIVKKEYNIDLSMTTNLIPFTEKNSERFVSNSTWIKASINAGTEEGYEAIHQTKKSDFNKAIANMERCVNIRNKNKYDCTLGAQMLLLPENRDQAVSLAKKMKDAGADYLVIKPYTQSLYGVSKKYEGLKYDDMLYLQDELDAISTDDFEVVFRANTMNKLNESKQPYSKCYSTPMFWTYIMADGAVYSCGAYLGNEKFHLGNINKNSFSEIWQGDKRKENFLHVKDTLDITECRRNCRMDEVNRYLWELNNPTSHVNFI